MCVIIGLTGLSGSGKSEVANYLEASGRFGIIRIGQHLRELRNISCSELNVEEFAEKYRFKSLGSDLVDKINQFHLEGKMVVIDSIRTVADYNLFLDYATDFTLVMVIADKEKRLQWLSNRMREGDSTNELKLQGHDYWEMTYGIDKLMVLADKFFINSSKIYDLCLAVEQYLYRNVINTVICSNK